MCILLLLLLLMGVHGFTKADRMGMRRGERGDHVIALALGRFSAKTFNLLLRT